MEDIEDYCLPIYLLADFVFAYDKRLVNERLSLNGCDGGKRMRMRYDRIVFGLLIRCVCR